MYEVFDNFLETKTWHTRHPSDEARFYLALNRVVKDSKFSADEMGEYMREKTKPPGTVKNHPFEFSIGHYVTEAWTVKGYLEAIGARSSR